MPKRKKLTPVEHELLQIIAENPGISPSEAARVIGIRPKTAGVLIWNLRANGLVKPSARDRSDPRWGKCWIEDSVDDGVSE